MKLNSHIIFLIAIVGIIVVGVVGATMLSNGPMKQVDFDGVKVNVPSDSNFIRTNDGFADSKYGISIHIFNDNNSASDFLKTKNGATVVSLKNQPPQSVAFKHADDTNVLVTNGLQYIDIGARDENLVSDMANTIVFANHQKSAKPDPILFAPPPYLEFHRDFYLIMPLFAKVNMNEFNTGIIENSLNVTINEHNSAIDNNTFNQYSAREFEQNTGNPLPSADQQNTSLLDNQNVSNVVNSVSSDNNGNSANGGSNPGSSGSGNGANSPIPSISPDAKTNNNPDVSSSSASSGSAPSSGGSSSASSSSAPSSGGNAHSNNQQQKLTKEQVKTLVLKKYPNYKIDGTIQDSGSVFIVPCKDSSGHSQKVRVDAYSGQILGAG